MDYKKKYRLLLGGAFLFLLLAYALAFGKTWAAYRATARLEQQLSNAGRAWQEIESYERELRQLDTEPSGTPFSQNALFQRVADFCQEHRLAIQAMPESTVYREQDLQLLHNTIRVQGDFIAMVRLLYYLEQEQRLGRIVSVEFALERNYQRRAEELTAHLHLQNVQNHTNQ